MEMEGLVLEAPESILVWRGEALSWALGEGLESSAEILGLVKSGAPVL